MGDLGGAVGGRYRVGDLGCRVGDLGGAVGGAVRGGRLGVQGRPVGVQGRQAGGLAQRPGRRCTAAACPRALSQAPGDLPRHRRVWELASRFLAKPIRISFAGSGNPPKSPPGRGGHCAPAGGYMRKERAEQRPAWEQTKV